jgi:hypothetical protein
MSQKRFERWNWQLDIGEKPLANEGPLPARFAVANYDHRGRLYRVVSRVKESADRSDYDPAAFGTYVYDYFCGEDGRILQKRSLDEHGMVFLIVDFEYDFAKNEVVETAWDPTDGRSQSIRRPIRTVEKASA